MRPEFRVTATTEVRLQRTATSDSLASSMAGVAAARRASPTTHQPGGVVGDDRAGWLQGVCSCRSGGGLTLNWGWAADEMTRRDRGTGRSDPLQLSLSYTLESRLSFEPS